MCRGVCKVFPPPNNAELQHFHFWRDGAQSVGTRLLTLVGFANDVDDLSGLQRELVRLLGDVLVHTLHLRAVCPQTHTRTHAAVRNYTNYSCQNVPLHTHKHAVISVHSSLTPVVVDDLLFVSVGVLGVGEGGHPPVHV